MPTAAVKLGMTAFLPATTDDHPITGKRRHLMAMRRHRVRLLRIVVPLAAVALAAAACGSGAPGTSGNRYGGSTGSTATSAAATVAVGSNANLGKIIVDGKGRTLYLFEKDTNGKSACSGSCTSVWPPLTTSGKPQAGSGVSASLLGTTTRSDGKTQVTYSGHPLYYYVSDTSTGQANGQGLNQFGALWYVVSPQGTAITGGVSASGGGGAY